MGYYEFWKEAKILTDKNIIAKVDKLKDLLSDCSYGFITDQICIVLTKPKVSVDNQWRLHNEEGMALVWKDGQGDYFLHGVRFEKELYDKVIARSLSFKEAMAIVDIDQRWVAIKFLGDKVLEGTKNQLLNKSDRGNELWLIEDLFPSHPKAYYLRYSCPSTGRVYFSGIDPEIGKEGNADVAMAWKHNLSVEAYALLSLENEG